MAAECDTLLERRDSYGSSHSEGFYHDDDDLLTSYEDLSRCDCCEGTCSDECVALGQDHHEAMEYGPDLVLLDHSTHIDCDEDLETVLIKGLCAQQPVPDEVTVQRAKEAVRKLQESVTCAKRHHRALQKVRALVSKVGTRVKKLQDSNVNSRSHVPPVTSSEDKFYDAADEVGYDSTPDSGVHENLNSLDPEQRARQEEEWREQLAKTEDEILTLRQVLASKVKESQELKRKLGITVWKEFRDDLDQGMKNVKDTEVYRNVNERITQIGLAVTSAPIYQKTETAVKTAAERTTSVLGTIGASVSRKLGDVKNSQTFKSFEERVGSAYTNVKDKVSGSRSNSVQSFEEALEASERNMSRNMTPAATPTIHENKPLV